MDDLEGQAMDLASDESRARWREQLHPMADFEDEHGRLPHEKERTMLEDVMEPVREGGKVFEPAKCKVEDCENNAATKLGPYGGLCTMHADEKKADRREKMKAQRREAKEPKEPPAAEKKQIDKLLYLDSATRELLLDIVLTDDSDLDLAQVRIDAARILLAPENRR